MVRKRKLPTSESQQPQSSLKGGSDAKRKKTKSSFAWSELGLNKNNVPQLLAYKNDDSSHSKFAGFDIDWTIVGTKSGKAFSQSADDWKLLFDKGLMVKKLKKLQDDDYQIIFFTNQAGIEKGKTSVKLIKTKIEAILTELDLPVYAFVSTGESHYRKPATGMYDFFVEKCNNKTKVDLTKSMYIGDAAGRPKDWKPGKKKDFSSSDRKFAENIGVKFLSPEEFFLDENPYKIAMDGFNPKNFMKTAGDRRKIVFHGPNQELILMCGLPGSGKSYFANRYLVSQGYESVNRDKLITQSKCLKAVEQALSTGKSVVVDNTNASKSNRAEYIKLAVKAKIPVRCFTMQTPEPIAHHLNLVRQNLSKGAQRRVPDVAYNVYKKHYEEPNKAEGISEILQIDFVPEFMNEEHQKEFLQWT